MSSVCIYNNLQCLLYLLSSLHIFLAVIFNKVFSLLFIWTSQHPWYYCVSNRKKQQKKAHLTTFTFTIIVYKVLYLWIEVLLIYKQWCFWGFVNLFWSYYRKESSVIVVISRTELQVLIVFLCWKDKWEKDQERRKSMRERESECRNMSDFIKSRGDAPQTTRCFYCIEPRALVNFPFFIHLALIRPPSSTLFIHSFSPTPSAESGIKWKNRAKIILVLLL